MALPPQTLPWHVLPCSSCAGMMNLLLPQNVGYAEGTAQTEAMQLMFWKRLLQNGWAR